MPVYDRTRVINRQDEHKDINESCRLHIEKGGVFLECPQKYNPVLMRVSNVPSYLGMETHYGTVMTVPYTQRLRVGHNCTFHLCVAHSATPFRGG